ncbi:hypothetical protein CVT25_014741 [Psilocybe cyanescens]|uniref:Uncharacterized protein n=1 Tax=Psilocybe cyanescens TaxID=93625 RepID=A0A409XJY0_PSICY|nr:hypothetical protein CVT25_014741 [Psilocybe cyanescens]
MLDNDIDPQDTRTDPGMANKRKITDLFDFNNNLWVTTAQQNAIGSLEDEMNIYDLLDLDAAVSYTNFDWI